MKTTFKEVIKFYLGCQVQENSGLKRTLILKRVMYDNRSDIAEVGTRTVSWNMFFREFKPILIPLNKLSDEQLIEVGMIKIQDLLQESDFVIKPDFKASDRIDYKVIIDGTYLYRTSTLKLDCLSPAQFKLLLSCNVDLFNLIDNSEAIDATTLNPNPYEAR